MQQSQTLGTKQDGKNSRRARVSLFYVLVTALAMISSLSAQTPTKEYIRLGSRVIAVETGAQAGDFSVSASPSSVTALAGDTAHYTVTVTPASGFTGSVQLSAVNPPLPVTITPTTITGAGSADVSVGNVLPGTYTLKIQGEATINGSPTKRDAEVTLVVPQPDFSLSLSSGSLAFNAGETRQVTATTASLNNLNGTVTFSAPNLPAGFQATFQPSSVSLSQATPTATTQLAIGVLSTVPNNVYSVTVHAESATGSHDSLVTVTVGPARFAVTPLTIQVDKMGGTGSIAVTSSASWTATRDASSSWITFTSAASGSGSGTLSYSVSANTTGQQRTGTIVFKSGTFTQSVTLTQTPISTDPPAVTFSRSGSGPSQTFTLTFTDNNGVSNISGYFYIGRDVSNAESCAVGFDTNARDLYLYADPGVVLAGVRYYATSGQPQDTTPLSNSQCDLMLAGSSLSISGDNRTLTLVLPVNIKNTYVGSLEILNYVRNNNTNLSTNWVKLGDWTAYTAQPVAPSAGMPQTLGGNGTTQRFQVDFSDVNGYRYIANEVFTFATAQATCQVLHQRRNNRAYILNDAGTDWLWSQPVTLGSVIAGSASNSRCVLSNANSSLSGNGNTLTVSFTMTFIDSSMAGSINVTGQGVDLDGRASPTSAAVGWTPQPDFWLLPSTSSVTVSPGELRSASITIRALAGFNASVSLTCSAPSGLVCTVPSSASPGSASVSFRNDSLGAGTYQLTITGTSGALSHNAVFSISVPEPDFVFSVSPGWLNITTQVGGSATLDIQPLYGFDGPVSFSCDTDWKLNCSISGNTLNITANFSINPYGDTHTVYVTASSGYIAHTEVVNVNVFWAIFTVDADPSSLTIRANQAGYITLTVNPVNGFQGNVEVSCSASISCSVSPSTVSAGSSTTLTVSGPSPGTYNVSFIGSSADAHASVFGNPVSVTITSP